MSIDTPGFSNLDRAQRYFAKAEQARQLMAGAANESERASLKKLVDDWEYLARQALGEQH